MCYCCCNGFGNFYSNDWMAAAWGLNMLSNMVRNTISSSSRRNNSQNAGNLGGSGNAGSSGNGSVSGNTNGMNTSIFGSSNLCGNLLTNPNLNMGGSVFDYLPGTNQFGYGSLGGVPSTYVGPTPFPTMNMNMDNSGLGGFSDASAFGSNPFTNPNYVPGLSDQDMSGLMGIPALLQIVTPPPTQGIPQQQQQTQAVQGGQGQQGAQQAQMQVQTHPQGQVQSGGQVSLQTNVTTPYTGTAADLNAKLGGVLAGKGQVFLNAQQQYGINAAVLASICMHESANGSSPLARSKNNVGGVRIAGSTEFRTYGSVDECILHIAEFLKRSYINQGLTTIAQIGAKYCPVTDPTDTQGLNSGWGAGVSRWYNQSFA